MRSLQFHNILYNLVLYSVPILTPHYFHSQLRGYTRFRSMWGPMVVNGSVWNDIQGIQRDAYKTSRFQFFPAKPKGSNCFTYSKGGIILHTSMTFDKYSWNISGCGAIQIRTAMVKVAILEIGCHVIFLTVN